MKRKQTLLARMKSPMPNFFKRLQKFGLICAGLGYYFTNPIGLPAEFELVPLVGHIGGYMIFVGGAVAAVCQFTKKEEE